MTITIERTVSTTTAPTTVFAYLLDFRHAVEWDPPTRTSELVSGDGGVGTVYRNVTSFAGNEVELTYTVESVDDTEERRQFVVVGRGESTRSRDTVTVTPHGPRGSQVVYRAEFDFTGVARLATPVLKPLLDLAGDHTAEQLKATLDRL